MRQVLALVLLLALAASVCAQPVPSVQLTWDAPQPVAGVNITGYQLARCDLPVTATSCTCTPTPLAGAITNATTTTYTDSPAPGLYCYSVLSLGTSGGQFATSMPAVPFLVVPVGVRTLPAPVMANFIVVVPQSVLKLVSVDSVEPGERYAAANAIDGDPTTFWHTPFTGTPRPHPHTLTLDLGQERWISGVRLTPRQQGTGGIVTQFRVEASRDGQEPFPIKAGTTPPDLPATPTPKDLRFAAVLARFVRVVTMASVSGQPFASIAEV
jgi:F5/8 type C domain